MAKVPSYFTECEEYRGFVIAVHAGNYQGFSSLAGQTCPMATRAAVRNEIDAIIDDLQKAFA